MEENKINKAKTYLVVMIFLLIIVLSAYIVVKKVMNRPEKVDEVVIKEKVLDRSTNKLELSLSNKAVKVLYDRVNDNSIDYLSYSYIGKELDWDIKSFITIKNIDSNMIKGNSIESESFKDMYYKIFGYEENMNLDSDECGRASYDEGKDEYVINEYCNFNKDNKYIQAYLKDVIAEEDSVKIRKYYVFIVKDIDGYSLYSSSITDESTLIAEDVSINEIPNYIDKMKVMTYVFKKGNDNSYFLEFVE